jgi:LCP family protein required for cell wall assembly
MREIFGRKFFIAFGVTIFSTMAVALGVYFALSAFAQAPVTPAYGEVFAPRPILSGGFTVESGSSLAGSNPSTTTTANEPSDAPYQPTMMRLARRPYFHTFLIVGIDQGNNADAIMVGAFDAQTQQAYLISLPRDTRVETTRTGVGTRKLVRGYSAGRANGGGHEGGINQLKDEVQTLVGFRPDFYVSLNFNAFTRMVDMVGGVEVTIPFNMQYTDPFQDLHIFLLAGTRRLNGQQALHFVRYREGDPGFRSITDYGRMQNQQQVAQSLLRELLSPRTITRVPELFRIYNAYVSTNLTYRNIAWFAAQLPGMDMGALDAYTLPIYATVQHGWYEMPYEAEILELINRTVNPFMVDITADMLRIVQ